MIQMIFLAILFISGYLLQTFLSIKQLNEFNKIYSKMKKSGRVAIGKRAGKIRAGSVVLLGLDSDDIIIDAQILQGVSVFARFKKLEDLKGLNIKDEQALNIILQKKNKITREAVKDAIRTYKNINNENFLDKPQKSVIKTVFSQIFKRNERSV